jgi:hypothetical protein
VSSANGGDVDAFSFDSGRRSIQRVLSFIDTVKSCVQVGDAAPDCDVTLLLGGCEPRAEAFFAFFPSLSSTVLLSLRCSSV